jgi:gentisate 1,2-dioxygenase
MGVVALLVLLASLALSGPRETGALDGPQPGVEWAKIETYRPRNLTLESIRRHGAIGSLNEGVEIQVQGMPARLMAWPGIGFQNQSIHVLTLRPGTESLKYTYALAEESFVCLFGQGEVFLRGQWVAIAPGDVAYFPEGITHAARNPATNTRDFVLISQITPPQIDLYVNGGFYDLKKAVFDYDAVFAAEKRATPGRLPQGLEAQYRETHPSLRAWNLSTEEIRRQGALFNIFRGAEFTGIDVPMRLILFPGYGTRFAGLHCAILPSQKTTKIHTHPISEDIIVTLSGRGWGYVDGKAVAQNQFDAAMATVLARHGGGGSQTANDPPGFVIGFGSPPQLDLYIETPYYKNGVYVRPEFKILSISQNGGK